MAKERLLFDPKSAGGTARRVLSSETPDDFRPAFGKVGQKILRMLASGPAYPAEIARALDTHHQTIYYHMKRLERSGLVTRVKSEVIRGGEANLFALSSDGYAIEFPVKGEQLPAFPASSRSKAFGRFFKEFLTEGKLDGWLVVGSPVPHGAGGTQARDGHYAIQLGFALGQFVRMPENFPVKLDVDIKAERLEGSNLVVVGGPRTNLIAEELNPHLAVRFKQGGFWGPIVDAQGREYASELDCVVVKRRNPWNEAGTVVVAAGLTGAGTKAAIIGICNFADSLFQGYRTGDFACVLRGTDRDGDGKVDSVELLRQL
ncbi:MAG: helix-turn-helix domain-containing protein [Nitrososphaerales archaeon]|nr:helix-turn-helix domain-containing protein [Nitrososphaerales archaeon]